MTLTPNNYGNNGYSKTQTNNLLDEKQDTLVSGTNIKTINGNTVLGSGNIEIGEGGTIVVDQTYDPTSIHAQSGVAVADALSNSIEMITQNGTISNCVLEIPQLLKLELSDNVITHKAGSIQTLCGDTYATYTLTQDRSTTIRNSLPDGLYFANPSNNGTLTITAQEKFGSGSSLPADGSVYERFFLTTDKKMYHYGADTWSSSGLNYPVCMIKMASGVATFAKDSNGNDMIFNGVGFIGHHAFVYPNVKALIPNGLNADGSLKSVKINNNALRIVEMITTTPAAGYEKILQMGSPGIYTSTNYREVESYNDLGTQNYSIQYVKKDNIIYYYNNATYETRVIIKILSYTYDGTTVTDFAIRQPVRLATTEMLDKIQDQVDTKQDTLVSGTNIKTINNNSILSNGNIALADQSLSNLDSNGQMIINSQNGTISNCILEIPQNIILELSGNVLTLKAGSVLTKSGNTYTTFTTTENKTRDIPSLANGRYSVFSAFSNGNIQNPHLISKILSGDTLPSISSDVEVFYLTTDKTFHLNDGTQSGFESNWPVAYPLCVIEMNNGVASFAKDSKGNDMIFNGAGFIGHHIFRLPNVSGYTGEGFTSGGKLNSTFYSPQNLLIQEMASTNPSYGKKAIGFQSATRMNYIEVDTVAESPAHQHISWIYTYVKEQNQIWVWNGAVLVYQHDSPLVYYNYNGTTVTDFAIRQPYQGARNLLTDDVDEQVKQNTTDITTKQADLTTASGYDATATQVLKNINGVLTWVTEE